MGKKCYSVVLLVVIAAVALALASSGTVAAAGGLVGGWSPIDPNDSHVQDLGKFAVSEHNSQTGDKLVFVKVISGQSQVVAGANYKLILSARSGSVTHTYEAVVYERAWENVRQLTSFALEN